MSWKTKDLIQNVNNYVKFYKINVNRSWTIIMKDETIPIEVRNLINGARFLFSEELNKKIITQCCYLKKDIIHIFPTGSKNLSSDIDVQITLNIDNIIELQLLKKIMYVLINLIKQGVRLWNVPSIEKKFRYKLLSTFYFKLYSK